MTIFGFDQGQTKCGALFIIMKNRRALRCQKIFEDRNTLLYHLDEVDVIKYTCKVPVNFMTFDDICINFPHSR